MDRITPLAACAADPASSADSLDGRAAGRVDTVGALRDERRRRSDAAARITWWRRLVLAERDLLVASVAGGPGLPGHDIDPRLAEVLDPRLRERATASASERLEALAELDRSLAAAEEEALGLLEDTTARLVTELTTDPAQALRSLPG